MKYSEFIDEALKIPHLISVHADNNNQNETIRIAEIDEELSEKHGIGYIKDYLLNKKNNRKRIVNIMQENECIRLMSILKDNSINCLSLFDNRMYNELFCIKHIKSINDINILVAKDKVQESSRLLIKEGYRLIYYDEKTNSYIDYNRNTILDTLINRYKFPPLILLNGNNITFRLFLWFELDWGHNKIRNIDKFISNDSYVEKMFIAQCIMNYRNLNTICKILQHNCIPILPYIETQISLSSKNVNIEKVLELCTTFSCYMLDRLQ